MFDETLGDDFQSTEELTSSPNQTVDALRSPGELEAQHHELLERQGNGSALNELADAARDFVRRAQPLGASLEEPRSRHHCQSILDYWSIFVYRNLQIEIDSELLPFDPSLSPTLDDSQFPYRFTEETDTAAQKMLGWRRLLDECERDLAGDHLLTVMGEADAGAHFLIHDLLGPHLRSGQARLQDLSGSEQWRYYEVPLGSDPINDLLQAVAAQDGHAPEWVSQQKAEFAHDQTTLRRILETSSAQPAVLVFCRFRAVLECSDSDHEAFVNNLAHVLQSPQRRFYAIVTLSRDRSMPLSSFGPLEKPLRDGHVRLAFTMAELRHLVEEPARRVGLIFETGLIDQILIDIQGEPAALPLLQFTLERLWKLRERNRITWQAFEQTGAGRAALSNVMDEVHDELTEPQRDVLRKIFLDMVRLEPSGSFTPREVTQEDLYRTSYNTSRIQEVLGRLRDRALIHESSLDGSASYTLTHSALLISWPPLVDWLEHFRDNERLRLRLRDAADQWKSGGKHKDLLWQGKMLAAALEKFENDSSLTTTEQEFLQASQARAARKKQMQILLCVAVVCAVIVAAVIRATERQLAENAKQRQQMLTEATEHLTKGELATALLWLDHRDNARSGLERKVEALGISSVDQHDVERAAMIRKLAGAQLPRLGPLAFSSIEDEYNQEYGFKRVAISPEQRYVAAMRKKSPQTAEASKRTTASLVNKDSQVNLVSLSNRTSPAKTEDATFSLTIRSLDLPARSDASAKNSPSHASNDWPALELFTHSQTGTPKDGAVAFINIATADAHPEYYLLASAGGLHAWKVPQLDSGKQPKSNDWHPVKIEPKTEMEKALSWPIVSIVAGGQGQVLTIEEEEVDLKRRLRLWKVEKGSDSKSIAFSSAPLPQGLEDANVQMALLSAKGDLLAVCKDRGVNELQVWRRPQSNKEAIWTRASPPTWVSDLKPQRLHDWGWSLKKAAASQLPQNSTWARKDSVIRTACFSPSGERFATACDDGQVLVWGFSQAEDEEGATMTYVAPLLETELRLGSTVFDVTLLSENVLATAGRDRTVRLWDVHTASEIAARAHHEGTVAQVAPAGADKLLTNTGGLLRIWTSDEYAMRNAPDLSPSITFSGDERRMLHILPASASGDLLAVEVRDWSAPPQVVRRLELPESFTEPPLIAVSRSADLMAAATKETESEETESKETDPELFLWTTMAKEHTNSDVERMLKSSVAIPSRITTSETANSPRKLALHQLAFGWYQGQDLLAVVGEEQDDSGKQRGVIFFGISDAKDKNPGLVLYTVTSSEQDSSYPHAEAVKCVLFSDSGELLVTGDKNDKAKTWQVADLVKQIEVKREKDAEGGKFIQSRHLHELRHSSDVVDLCFAPETSDSPELLLATVSSEGEAATWTVRADITPPPKPVILEANYTLQHDANILSVSFNPDGRWIVTGGADRAVRIWNTAEGKLAGIFRYSGPVEYAALLDEDRLVSASRSSVVMNHDQPPALEIRERTLIDFSLDSVELKKLAAQEMNEDGQLRRLDVNEYRDTALSAVAQ